MTQSVAFFEVVSTDHERTQRFYRELFGWRVTADPDMGGYGTVPTDAEETPVGGIGLKVYLQVPDLDTYLERAESLGGTRVIPPTGLPCDGNPVGLWA
ncbi:VOC family protein [Actinophytocola sediminis]